MRIFSPLGTAQTSLALRSLTEKIHNSKLNEGFSPFGGNGKGGDYQDEN